MRFTFNCLILENSICAPQIIFNAQVTLYNNLLCWNITNLLSTSNFFFPPNLILSLSFILLSIAIQP